MLYLLGQMGLVLHLWPNSSQKQEHCPVCTTVSVRVSRRTTSVCLSWQSLPSQWTPSLKGRLLMTCSCREKQFQLIDVAIHWLLTEYFLKSSLSFTVMRSSFVDLPYSFLLMVLASSFPFLFLDNATGVLLVLVDGLKYSTYY